MAKFTPITLLIFMLQKELTEMTIPQYKKYYKDKGMKPAQFDQLWEVAQSGNDLQLDPETPASESKWLNTMFKSMVKEIEETKKNVAKRASDAAAAQAAKEKQGKQFALATAEGFAKNEIFIDQTVEVIQHGLGKKFVVTKTGLELAPDAKISPLDYGKAIAMLASGTEGAKTVANSMTWALGDLLRLARKNLGDEETDIIIAQVVEQTGQAKHTVAEAERVSTVFPPDERFPTLTYTHHQEIANYKGNIKAGELKKIVAKVVAGEDANARVIFSPSGEKITQRRPLSCAATRSLLKEASGTATTTEKPAKGKDVTNTPEPEAKAPLKVEVLTTFLYITTEGTAFQSQGKTALIDMMQDDETAFTIDLDTMRFVKSDGSEGDLIPQAPVKKVAAKKAAKKAASAKKTVPDIDSAAEAEDDGLPD